jgi:hypothetical protein
VLVPNQVDADKPLYISAIITSVRCSPNPSIPQRTKSPASALCKIDAMSVADTLRPHAAFANWQTRAQLYFVHATERGFERTTIQVAQVMRRSLEIHSCLFQDL